jgi:hypothetical protein
MMKVNENKFKQIFKQRMEEKKMSQYDAEPMAADTGLKNDLPVTFGRFRVQHAVTPTSQSR